MKKICNLLGVKKTLVYRSLTHFRHYGVSYNPHAHQPGRCRMLSHEDLKLIVALLNQRHCIYLNELQAELYNIRGTFLSQTTLMRTLHHLHYSRKCVTTHALERDNLIRSAFMNRIADEVPNPDMLIFIDEAARNRRASARTKGWSLVGRRCVQRRHFIRGQRFSILPILTLDGIITYDIIPGSVDLERFVQFLRELVVSSFSPLLCLKCLTQRPDSPYKSLPWASKCSILDNCNIHHAEDVRKLVEDEAGMFFIVCVVILTDISAARMQAYLSSSILA